MALRVFYHFIQDSEEVSIWEKGQLLVFNAKITYCDRVAKQLLIEFEGSIPLIKEKSVYLIKFFYESGIYFASGHLAKSERTGQINFSLMDEVYKFERRSSVRLSNRQVKLKISVFFSLDKDELESEDTEIRDQEGFYFQEFLKHYRIEDNKKIYFFSVLDISDTGLSFIAGKDDGNLIIGKKISGLKIIFKTQEYIVNESKIVSKTPLEGSGQTGEFVRIALKFQEISSEQKNCLRDQVLSELNYAKTKNKAR